MGLFNKFTNNKVIMPADRRANTIKIIEKMGVAYNKHLPLIGNDSNIKLKSVEYVTKRSMACMLSVQLACSIRKGEDYVSSLAFVLEKMEEWNLSLDDFLPKERKLIENKFTKKENDNELTQQDIIDIVWTYEVYWALIWALDLISDKELMNATKICNTERAMAISALISDMSSSLKLRNIEKILNMLDLYYLYHWACVEKQINANTATGNLDAEVVVERRRGLEWLISEEEDWNNISLHT